MVNLRAATELNTQLASSSQALQAFAQNPVVALGLEDFTHTLQIGNPVVAGLAPAQAICNYITLTFPATPAPPIPAQSASGATAPR